MTTLSSCEKKRDLNDNPFFEEWDTPHGVPPFSKIMPEHYEKAFERAFSLYAEEINQIVSNNETPSFQNTIEAFDRAGEMFERVYNIFEYICDTASSKEIREAQKTILPKVKLFLSSIYQNEKLFDKVSRIYDRRMSLELDKTERRLVEKIYERFTDGGALLDKSQRSRLQDIETQCVEIQSAISANILAQDSTYYFEVPISKVEGLPLEIKDLAREEANRRNLEDKMVFTFRRSSIFPFLQTSNNRDLRKSFYTAYTSRCNKGEWDNTDNIHRLMELRAEKAEMLGFRSYAHYRISHQNEKNPDKIFSMVKEIFKYANLKAKEERGRLFTQFTMDNRECDSTDFKSWDWWYYAEKLRKKEYISDDQIRNFFSLDNVQLGAFNLLNRLYGITFRPIAAPTYEKNVRVYEVINDDLSSLGVLYIDPYSRNGKKQGAWCSELVPSREINGKRRAAIVAVSYNFTEPIDKNRPTLLGLKEVRTFFHEMGHAIHFLFCRTKYNLLRHPEWDVVEFPSKLMEQWAFEPSILRSYAFHYRNSEAISKSSIEKIQKVLLFNQGFDLTELSAAALLDLEIHMLKDYTDFNADSFQQEVLYKKYEMIPQIEPRYRLPYFAHILKDDYAAGYYFYLYSEVMAHDTFDAFVQTGDVTDKRMAQQLRKYLESSGDLDGESSYQAMIGHQPEIMHMLLRRGMIQKQKEEEIDKEQVEDSDE
ncbi:MAG: M3 family metallopeptidase [Alistipes sp.]|nr:M3 family metallopeptidase [Candidatus Alistipes equi]